MSIDVSYNLIKLIKAGDKQSFGILMDHCNQFVYAVSLKMIGDVDEARDVAQESFIKVWQKINKYNSHYKFTTWLYKIVINTCLDRLRKKARHNAIFTPMDDQDDLYNAMLVSPTFEFEEKQLVNFIRMIASKLSAKQHSVFVLHDLEELSQEEISKILRMTRGSVKSNLYHARKAIRKVLSSWDNKIMTTSDGM